MSTEESVRYRPRREEKPEEVIDGIKSETQEDERNCNRHCDTTPAPVAQPIGLHRRQLRHPIRLTDPDRVLDFRSRLAVFLERLRGWHCGSVSDDPVGGFVEMLSTAGAELAPGLSNTEIELVEDRFGIVFNSEHRALLREILPLGRYWPDWRDGNPDAIHRALQHPIDGALFDVEANSFWALGWGSRPAQVDAALQVARRQLATVPTLVPVYGHRYTPQAGTSNAHPVFSVVPTDVIYYGRDIRHYLAVEFPRRAVQDAQDRSDHSGIYDREVAAILEDRSRFYVPFWSELAENRPDDL